MIFFISFLFLLFFCFVFEYVYTVNEYPWRFQCWHFVVSDKLCPTCYTSMYIRLHLSIIIKKRCKKIGMWRWSGGVCIANFKKRKQIETEIYGGQFFFNIRSTWRREKWWQVKKGRKKIGRGKLKRAQKRTRRYVTQQVCNGWMASTRNKRFSR